MPLVLAPHETRSIIQARIETGADHNSSIVLHRVQELYQNPNAPFEKKATIPVSHHYSSKGIIGCTCGGRDGCPYATNILIG